MTPDESIRLIDSAGGDSAFAKLIGIDEQPGFQQRVNNWKRRGIPADVLLEHYDLIRGLAAQAEKNPGAAA